MLTSGGSLLLSTSNALRTLRANGRPAHPVHLSRFEPLGFRALLEEHFAEVTLLGQITKDYYPVSPQWEDARTVPSHCSGEKNSYVCMDAAEPAPVRGQRRGDAFLHNRSFFPGEFDFDFLPEQVERGHVTVAVCR